MVIVAGRAWKPLEDFAAKHPEIKPVDFMYMGQDGFAMFLYKHRDTRRYLCLNADAEPYTFVRPTSTTALHYEATLDETAIAHVLSQSTLTAKVQSIREFNGYEPGE